MSRFRGMLVAVVLLMACAAGAYSSTTSPPRAELAGVSVEPYAAGDSIRLIVGWNNPPADAAGAIDSIAVAWTYGTQPLQRKGHRLPRAVDTARFASPGICEWATGAVALSNWRREQPSATITLQFEHGRPCPAPAAPMAARWVDSTRPYPP